MPMRRIRLIIEYDGTSYVGWQTQKNGVAVQALLERELEKITGEKIALHGSGRTDSGVHALAQVAHFDIAARMPADKFAYALNAGLPKDIRVKYSDEAPPDFHARFSAKRKHYRYCVLYDSFGSAFLRSTALHVRGQLDFELIETSAKDVLGEHDFLAFMASGSSLENTVRTVYRSQWSREGKLFYYDVEGNGFLYNMVRILVGTMLEIGKGHLPPDTIKKALISRSRFDAGATAPAHGLTLMRVVYPEFDTRDHQKSDAALPHITFLS